MTMTSDLSDAAQRLADLGFWLDSHYPVHPGASRLMVAIRDKPTLRHYDPERIRYWTTGDEGRGRAVDITRRTKLPVEGRFSWGKVELFDRLGVQNDYVSLGGDVAADEGGPDTTLVVFSSPGPILSLGGHSQFEDPIATDLGAFFGRIMVPIDFEPGVEQAISRSKPLDRYAAFVCYETRRFRRHPILANEHPHHASILAEESRRLQRDEPFAWAAGGRLLARMGLEEGQGVGRGAQL
jgi:hypothetical protein